MAGRLGVRLDAAPSGMNRIAARSKDERVAILGFGAYGTSLRLDRPKLLDGSIQRSRRVRDQLDVIEAHDCFSITELVTVEDLVISPEGGAVTDVLQGFYDADGQIPCQIDGGCLRCFRQSIGASGLRMIYEIYQQMTGRAVELQIRPEPASGLTHILAERRVPTCAASPYRADIVSSRVTAHPNAALSGNSHTHAMLRATDRPPALQREAFQRPGLIPLTLQDSGA